ncbi:hypothetical protein BJX99DRAFT_214067 [Aspergillus californicus]
MTQTFESRPCTITPINLTNSTEYETLRQQRNLCGWDNTPDKFTLWRQKQEEGLKSFFWITVPCRTNGPDEPDDAIIRAGHISLDAYAEPADDELANASKTNLTIQNFFISPEYRAGGIGRAAMGLVEEMATKKPYGSPECEYITLTTMSKKHYYDPVLGPHIRKVMPLCNQEWYERQGYVAWKEEGRYPDTLPDKTKIVYDAVFMRKRV